MSSIIRTHVHWPRLFRALSVLALLAWGLVPGGIAAGESRIELRDGSVLNGELIGVGDGRYRIRSSVMGVIEVAESDVLSIRPATVDGAPGVAGGTGAVDYGSEISAIQRQLSGDPAMLGSIMALQSDPQLQAALADPEFAQMVLSGDLASLQNDPRFLNLMRHPAIQAILGQMQGR